MIIKRSWIFFLFVHLTFAGSDYHNKQILFCLKHDVPALQSSLSAQSGVPVTQHKALNHVLQRYDAIKIERWLPSADANDVVDDVDLSRIYVAHFRTKRSIQELKTMLTDFRNITSVHSAELSSVYRLHTSSKSYTPDDEFINRQDYLGNIKAFYAWGLWKHYSRWQKLDTVLVGVVDSGIDYLHPDLKDKLYINPGEDINNDGQITAADSNGIDDDGNGFEDDFMGWDYAGPKEDWGPSPDNDIRPPNSGQYYSLSHGTHVMGTIAARFNNGIGVSGIAPHVRVIATKHSFDDDVSETHIIKGYDGILYCAKLGAKIINCSWGGRGSDLYGKLVIRQVSDDYNAIVVCASGNESNNNDNTPHYPSDYARTIAVSALGNNDQKASFSNYGKVIDISAPGTNIYNTVHANNGGYAYLSGTSMASPVAAGSFALLRSFFPDSGRSWLIDKVLSTADPVDHLNPGYEGLLGSGRVNAYNAVAQDVFPNIAVDNISFTITNDPIRKRVMPGDSVEINLSVSNKFGWKKAESVNVKLSAADNVGVTVIDSLLTFGAITSGDSVHSGEDSFSVWVSPDATYAPLPLLLSLHANSESEFVYRDTIQFNIDVNAYQSGFPALQKPLTGAAAIADLKGDRNKEIIVFDDENQCFAVDAQGSTLDNFPVSLGGYTTMPPIVADVDADGYKEIVAVNRSALITIISNDGEVQRIIDLDETVLGTAAVANMDQDEQLEIVFGSLSNKIHAVKPDSTALEGFPVEVSDGVNRGVALADIAGDERPEIIFGTMDFNLNVLNAEGASIPGFPLSLSSWIKFTPVVYRGNNHSRIAIALNDKSIVICDEAGQVITQKSLSGYVNSPLSLGDMNGNGTPQFVFTTNDNQLHAMTLEGEYHNHYPYTLDSEVPNAVVFADIDGNGKNEMVVARGDGNINLLTDETASYQGFPAELTGRLNGSPAVADIDRDGDFEIAIGGSEGLHVIDVHSTSSREASWTTELGSNNRTGFYNDVLTHLVSEKKQYTKMTYKLNQNYPNPFNPETIISFYLPEETEVKLQIFNVLGQQIRTLLNAMQSKGLNEVRWDGKNDEGFEVPSGIYVYRIIFNENGESKRFKSRKMLLLR